MRLLTAYLANFFILLFLDVSIIFGQFHLHLITALI